MSQRFPVIEFGSGIRASVAAEVYTRTGRVHIANFLSPACAERAYLSLTSEVPWQLHFNDGDRLYDLSADQLDALPEPDRVGLMEAIYQKAAHKFQFLFDNFSISDMYAKQLHLDLYVMGVLEFLNSPRFLDYARKLTGIRDISLVDAQATRYRASHFLTCHDDNVIGKNRVAAYVLSLTPRWHADLGGILSFIDKDGHVAEGFVPHFNALNIFRVPQKHAVSCVAPFAPYPRLSISGWFRRG